MSLTATQRPAAWTWAFSPIVYKLQRKDKSFDPVDSNGGFIRIKFTGVDETANFSVDDLVYLKSDNNVYDLNAKVTGVVYAAGDTKVTFDQPYTSAATTGFVNLFTKRAGYQVEVFLPRWASPRIDTPRIDDPVMYTPNKKGALTIDIQIIQSLLSPDIASVPFSYVLSDDSANHFLERWLAYREVWQGSAESVIDDSVNDTGFSAFGAAQIGGTNDMDKYVMDGPTKKFLTLMDSPTLMELQYFNISLLTDQTDAVIVVERYLNKVFQSRTLVSLSGQENKLMRLGLVRSATEDQIQLFLAQGGSDVILAPTAWSDGADAFTKGPTAFGKVPPTPGTTYSAYQTVHVSPGDSAVINVDITGTTFNTPTGPGLRVRFSLWDSYAGTMLAFVNKDSLGPSFTGNVTIVNSSAVHATVLLIEMIYTGTSLASAIITVNNIGDPIGSGYEDGTRYSETKIIKVIEQRPNPVNIMWWNYFGGIENYVFSINQDVSLNLSDVKAKRMRLFADNITPNEWEAIQGMNTIGEIYRPSIPELTAGITGSSKRIGQQVIVVDGAGNLTNVIALPVDSSLSMHNVKAYAQFEIEFPEVFAP